MLDLIRKREMTKIFRYVLILVLLFIIMILQAESSSPIIPDEPPIIDLDTELKRQFERNDLVRIDELLDMGIIKIRPGMTILDIGTGAGYFAFKFAERLKGTGRIFATDVLSDRVDYVKKEADKRGFRDIYPVLVTEDGVDEFYSKHKYDLIFLCNVYLYIDDPVDYFRKMRKFLAEDGELIQIVCKNTFLFCVDDIADFKGLVNELSQELHENKPFFKRLRQSTRKLIKQQSNRQPDGILRNAIVNDFNQMLLDPHFYNDFQGKRQIYTTVYFSPAEKSFYNWLLMSLKEDGVLNKAQKDLNPKEVRTIIKLNKLLFVQRFKQYFFMKGDRPFFCIGDLFEQTSRFLVERELKEAGYKLKNVYDSLPYHDILFFAANKDEEE